METEELQGTITSVAQSKFLIDRPQVKLKVTRKEVSSKAS
jgi:hypothetical protein